MNLYDQIEDMGERLQQSLANKTALINQKEKKERQLHEAQQRKENAELARAFLGEVALQTQKNLEYPRD